VLVAVVAILLNIYSVVLGIRATAGPGKLGNAGRWKVNIALAMNAAMMLVLALFFLGAFRLVLGAFL
jgi:hypothetical protein